METIFIYFLKASALLAVYFMAYHFLLRKETFFTTNRWFLLAGIITSAVMPLLFIKKIIMVEKPKMSLNDMAQYSDYQTIPVQETVTIDWFQITAYGYALISMILFIKIVTHLISLFKLLHKKEVVKKERFSLVDLNEDIAPFSFFNYIVYNSSYYTHDELNSILLHEKIHSQEKHSIDIMLAKLFCIIFWFNPFMWLYKKAITQNLEYIADQKAIQHIEDKRVYQKALLKVVSHQNCLSITNHFYQSLIKKRIVMLNKNQSKKSNSWKYALVLPALIAFVIFFQVKVIAQEKESKENFKTESKQHSAGVFQITKNTTDSELKETEKNLKSNYNVSAKFSKIKRNQKSELTSVKVDVKTPDGEATTYQFSGDEPLKTFTIVVNKDEDGIVDVDFDSNDDGDDDHEYAFSFSNHDEIADVEAPTPPTPPRPSMSSVPPVPPVPPVYPYQDIMSAPNAPEMPEFPVAPEFPSDMKDKKAMAAYEKDMAAFEKKMDKIGDEFETKMEIFEKQMAQNDPKMKNFEKGMKNFEKEMAKFEEDMERYQNQADDERDVEIERGQKEAEIARKEANISRKEAMKAREEAMKHRGEVVKVRKEIRKTLEEK